MGMTEDQKRLVQLEEQVKELQFRLKESITKNEKEAEWFQNIIDSLPNPLFIKNESSSYTTTNAAFEQLVKFSKEELLGRTDHDLFIPEEANEFLRVDSEIITNGGINWSEETLTIENDVHNLITSKVRLEDGNHNKYILGVITDITDKANQHVLLEHKKDELEKEKKNVQTLLKEVHHRVKNNLQVVSSLLNLQMEKFEEEQVKQAFFNCKGRIAAMAKVHEILYKTENFSNINFATYVMTLIENLKLSLRAENEVNFKVNLINIFLNVDIAIPLGMAINEIVTNSIKHGKIEGEQLEIYLDLWVNKRVCELNIGDNGLGINNERSRTFSTFGRELIALFCKQIDATLQVMDRGEGVHYNISFISKK